jgi:hypothetical protein
MGKVTNVMGAMASGKGGSQRYPPHQWQEFGVKSPSFEKVTMALEANSVALKHAGYIVESRLCQR